MLGGVRGILQQMKGDKVKPDLKTFQELLLLSRPLEIWVRKPFTCICFHLIGGSLH